MELDSEALLHMFRSMVKIREFEEAAGRLAEQAKIPGAVHLYVGEEAVAVGVCSELTVDDAITSTHRGHGHCIAKGGDVKAMFAELYGTGDRLLPRQGRLDAHRRPRPGHPGRERHRRRRRADGDGRRLRVEVQGRRHRLRAVLRRRRHERGRLARVDELRGAVRATPDHDRREQPLGRVQPPGSTGADPGAVRARCLLRHARRARRRPGRRRRSARPRARPSTARATAGAPA